LPGGGEGDLAGGKRTAADLGAWLVFEDESGQGPEAAEGTAPGDGAAIPPVVKSDRAGTQHAGVAGRADRHPARPPGSADLPHPPPAAGMAMTSARASPRTDYARFLDAAHQQLGGPLVVVWDGPEHPYQRRDAGS